VRALIDWANGEHGITRFVASTTPDNVASLGVLRKLAFRQIGDEAGEVTFELLQP
jgi:RimJ/RimL family protein N-acetyltransferase